MNKRFKNDNFIYTINEGIFNKLAHAVTGIGRKITPDPVMLDPMPQRASSRSKPGNRVSAPLPSNSPEQKFRDGAAALLPPDLVKKIWTKKKVELQQKEFFINVLYKDPEAIDYLKNGIKRVLCGDVQLDITDYTQFDSVIIYFTREGILPDLYKDLSKDVYDMLYVKSEKKSEKKSKKKSEELAMICNQLVENKILYASLLELGPSSQGLGSYDERFKIPTGIDRADDSGLLNFSDNIDTCNGNYSKQEEEEEASSNFSR